MPFRPIQSDRVAHAVIRQIEQLILRGILRPGDRLPSERDLAERMGVSRPSLREAIADLQERGLITSKAGSGIFVTDALTSGFSKPLVALFSRHDEAVFDYLSLRRDMEGLAAERAALHGTDTDLQVIATIFAKMEAAHQKRNPEEEARIDADFHLAIVEASHNVMMLHMMRALYGLLREGVFYNRSIMFKQRTTRAALLEQHRAIYDALQARNAKAARAAVESHLSFVEEALFADRKTEAQSDIAKQRLAREDRDL